MKRRFNTPVPCPVFFLGQEVQTKDVKGIIVELNMQWNGLYIEPHTSEDVVWFSSENAVISIVGGKWHTLAYKLSEMYIPKNEKCGRLSKAAKIIRHKHAMYRLWHKNGGYEGTNVPFFKVVCHDLGKIFTTLILGESKAKQYHKKRAHHLCLEDETYPAFCLDANGGFVSDSLTEYFSEAYLDWACARMTKADKPLDAIQTADILYPKFAGVARAYFKKYGYK